MIWMTYSKITKLSMPGYFNDYVLADPNRLLPVDALEEDVKEGKIKAIDHLTYAMPACTTVSKKCEENGAIIAQDILAKGEADAVILTST